MIAAALSEGFQTPFDQTAALKKGKGIACYTQCRVDCAERIAFARAMSVRHSGSGCVAVSQQWLPLSTRSCGSRRAAPITEKLKRVPKRKPAPAAPAAVAASRKAQQPLEAFFLPPERIPPGPS